MARKLDTLTVGELLELLEGEDRDKKVIFTTDYGDYHHTPQALPIRGEVDEATVGESAYSNSGFQLVDVDGDDDEDGDTDTETYLVIR
jgi:hypothetical protein